MATRPRSDAHRTADAHRRKKLVQWQVSANPDTQPERAALLEQAKSAGDLTDRFWAMLEKNQK